eukprot:GHVU01077499.1.p1 GENE.GHVU01077499.1~~GHVU01077499.1.p1  ORF type:complete len:128 (-),score=4.37 GHVU01077499.1:1557-1919(-)
MAIASGFFNAVFTPQAFFLLTAAQLLRFGLGQLNSGSKHSAFISKNPGILGVAAAKTVDIDIARIIPYGFGVFTCVELLPIISISVAMSRSGPTFSLVAGLIVYCMVMIIDDFYQSLLFF